MAQAFDSLSTSEAGGNDRQSFLRHERSGPYTTLDSSSDVWGDIEVELANLRNAAKVVECVGESDACDEDITASLRFISAGLEATVERLAQLLGLGRGEERS